MCRRLEKTVPPTRSTSPIVFARDAVDCSQSWESDVRERREIAVG